MDESMCWSAALLIPILLSVELEETAWLVLTGPPVNVEAGGNAIERSRRKYPIRDSKEIWSSHTARL